MTRKIKQIASANASNGTSMLIALADDGTLWKVLLNSADSEINRPWIQIPDLPDDAPVDFSKPAAD